MHSAVKMFTRNIIANLLLFLSMAQGQQRATLRNNLVYTFSYFPKNWTLSADNCHLHYNGNLVETSTADLQEYLTRQFTYTVREGDYWIGLRNQSVWNWVTNSPLSAANWAPGAESEVGNCVSVASKTGQWNRRMCSTDLPYVCEAMFVKRENYFRLNETGRVHFLTQVKLRFQEANLLCGKVGKQLAVINSQVLQDCISKKLKSIPGNTEFYIGLSMKGGMLTWSDGSSVDRTGFENWDEGYPDVIDETGCVYVMKNGKWRNGVCTTTRNFICQELAPIIETTTAQRAITENASNRTTPANAVSNTSMGSMASTQMMLTTDRNTDWKYISTTSTGNHVQYNGNERIVFLLLISLLLHMFVYS